MTAFKALKDISNKFESDLQVTSTQLFTTKIGVKFEDVVSNKMRDLALYSSKLKLLKAKPLSLTPQVLQSEKVNVINDYEDAACLKVLEQMLVKSTTQSNVVKKLLTTPTRNLEPELVEQKENLTKVLLTFRDKETTLRHMNELLKEKEAELFLMRSEWDELVGVMKDIKENKDEMEEVTGGPLYSKLSKITNKLELIRWLLSRALLSRGQYDWLGDQRSLLTALTKTRKQYTVHSFLE